MTAQVRDRVLYEGEVCWLAVTEDPFLPCFEQIESPEWGVVLDTAHQLRRYSCCWEVVDERLWLTGVKVWAANPHESAWAMQGVRNMFAGLPDAEAQVTRFLTECDTAGLPGKPPIRGFLKIGVQLMGDARSVRFFFPGQDRALATWFTGELCIPCGTPDCDMEGWWTHRHPYCVYLTIEGGVVIGRRVVRREDRPENRHECRDGDGGGTGG